jgi:hypothetical protein
MDGCNHKATQIWKLIIVLAALPITCEKFTGLYFEDSFQAGFRTLNFA